MVSFEVVDEFVKETLSEKRYFHSKCVMDRCVELAKIYGVDIEKAKYVGIAHDIAKEMSKDDKLKYVKDNEIEIDDVERVNVELLHPIIGADICMKKFGFSEDMVEAVRNHTTGRPNMDMLSKILFIGDVTSNDRKYGSIGNMIELANKDIDKAILENLDFTIKDIVEKGRILHLDTVRTRNWILREDR